MSDHQTFLDQAVETLRREVPEDLEWLAWNEMPAMRWRDGGAAVDPRIPKGWLVASAERGDPRPDDRLQRRAALFDPVDAATLGTWLLSAWLEHDTAVPELTEGRRRELRAMAERAASLAQRMGRGGTDPDERYRQLLAQEDARPEPSALPHRGLLAVVAACAGGEVADDVDRYVRARHRERPAQCRALLEMLSAIDDDDARELLASARRLPGLG